MERRLFYFSVFRFVEPPVLSAWAAVQFNKTFMSRCSEGLIALPFLWSCIAFGSISLVVGAQAVQQHADFFDRRTQRYFGLRGSNKLAQSCHLFVQAVRFICWMTEIVGIFVYSHLDLGLCHAVMFIVANALLACKQGCRLFGFFFGRRSAQF